MEYEEHEKRAWSVDFSRTDPSMLVSGSDDCKVGSADHHIHYYDLRNISRPVHVFSGHKKAVSYVKFLSNDELASASTDSTLRLWDVKQNIPVRTFRGHANEKNFVGLTVSSEYIACGSETNEVFVYHKEISKPLTWHRFGSPDMDDGEDEAGSYFISAVCWKSDRPTILTANSQGTIKVLVLAAIKQSQKVLKVGKSGSIGVGERRSEKGKEAVVIDKEAGGGQEAERTQGERVGGGLEKSEGTIM
ncbi:hypothetical protein TSUD_249340 [Trifolium subterraneum]|nr:hypothetical protein TSUD_249340 [Trifolium subterraneum]